MRSSYKLPFARFVKKQTRAFQLAIEDEVIAVTKDPSKGEVKKGDLSGVRVHKFKYHGQLYLIAYSLEGDALVFYMIDTHDNFYSALKRYLKEAQ